LTVWPDEDPEQGWSDGGRPCPECEIIDMIRDDHSWVCPACGYETTEPDADAPDVQEGWDAPDADPPPTPADVVPDFMRAAMEAAGVDADEVGRKAADIEARGGVDALSLNEYGKIIPPSFIEPDREFGDTQESLLGDEQPPLATDDEADTHAYDRDPF
jgi:hypothetical protein